MRFIVGDLLTGRRIQNVPVVAGSWSEVLNRAGDIACTVTLSDPAVRRLELGNSAVAGKSFLAAVEGDAVLQAGPIWGHQWDAQSSRLTLVGAGLRSYFDRRVLLPYTALNPTDPATDTNVVSSLQGIARFYVEQSMTWPGGDLPIILPDEIPGTNERNEPGANLALIGPRLDDLTGVIDGPDIHFAPRLTADRLGVEWVMRIGTPTQPMLFSPQDVVFNVGIAGSSVSNLRVEVASSNLASRAYATGGRASDTVLISAAEDPTLPNSGFPILERVDSSHSTVIETATLDAHAAAIVQTGKTPIASLDFDHDISQPPYATAFTVGDFASVRIRDEPYLGTPDFPLRMRITARSGTAQGTKVRVDLQPEVS